MNAGAIDFENPATGLDVVLADDVVVTVDGDRLTSIEVLDLARWGSPFDETAAGRVIDWVRARLAGDGITIPVA